MGARPHVGRRRTAGRSIVGSNLQLGRDHTEQRRLADHVAGRRPTASTRPDGPRACRDGDEPDGMPRESREACSMRSSRRTPADERAIGSTAEPPPLVQELAGGVAKRADRSKHRRPQITRWSQRAGGAYSPLSNGTLVTARPDAPASGSETSAAEHDGRNGRHGLPRAPESEGVDRGKSASETTIQTRLALSGSATVRVAHVRLDHARHLEKRRPEPVWVRLACAGGAHHDRCHWPTWPMGFALPRDAGPASWSTTSPHTRVQA